MFFYMAFCDFFLAGAMLLAFTYPFHSSQPLTKDSLQCKMTFLLVNFFSTATVLWYFMIALNIFLTIRGVEPNTLQRYSKYQHCFVWGYPLVATIVPFGLDRYNPLDEEYYCWYSGPRDANRFLVYSAVILSLSFCVFLLLYAIAASICSRDLFTSQSGVVFFRLTITVIAFSLVWGFALYQRISDWVCNGPQVDEPCRIALTASGFCNFIVWGATSPRVLHAWCHFYVSRSPVLSTNDVRSPHSQPSQLTSRGENDLRSPFPSSESLNSPKEEWPTDDRVTPPYTLLSSPQQTNR